MKNHLYVVYNKLSKRYETVFCYPSDAFASKQCEKMKLPLDEYELCRIGSIGIEDGVVVPENPVRIVLDYSVELPTTDAE